MKASTNFSFVKSTSTLILLFLVVGCASSQSKSDAKTKMQQPPAASAQTLKEYDDYREKQITANPANEVQKQKETEANVAFEKADYKKLKNLCSKGNELACGAKIALDSGTRGDEKTARIECDTGKNDYACKAVTVFDARAAGDADKIADFCSNDHNPISCIVIKDTLESCNKKNGISCAWTALFSKRLSPNEGSGNAAYKKYVTLACKYGDKNSCAIVQTLRENERAAKEEAKAQNAINKVHDKVKCGMGFQDVIGSLGIPVSTLDCTDNVYAAYRYGRRWVLFKGGGAFGIVDQADFKTACWASSDNDSVNYWDVCKSD